MPQVKLVEVIDATAKDPKSPPENILLRGIGKNWLCKKGEMHHMMSATFRLAKPTVITHIDIGNAGSASITALVSKSGCKEFKEIVPSTVLRTEADCRNGVQEMGVKMFVGSELKQDTRHEKWDLVRFVCCQPYRRSKDEQFGLSFAVVHGLNPSPPKINSVSKFKESAMRASLPAKKDVTFANTLSRSEKIIRAAKPIATSPVSPTTQNDEDFFKGTVISFLEANTGVINSKSPAEAKDELLLQLQQILERKLSVTETRIFNLIFRSQFRPQKDKFSPGILTPRSSNHQILSLQESQKMEDTKKSLLKPQLNESFNAFNTQTVYWAEVVHHHGLKDGPVSYMGRSGKENSPFLLEKNSLTNGDVLIEDSPPPLLSCERTLCSDQVKKDKYSPRDSWKNRNEVDKCESRECSPDTWLKRKSDSSERPQHSIKKRPRENLPSEDPCGDSLAMNRVTPSGGWLLNNTGLHKKKLSPPDTSKNDSAKFPFRVSPPPPPDRPVSPLLLVDDIDQPSTSSRETVAERNIRLEMERRLAERSPPERVVQRTSAGKVKGTFCTKGMNTNDSPLRRLSICDEVEEICSPQARRKLSFLPLNGQNGESDSVECPVCKCVMQAGLIEKHLDECVPSPIKKPDECENEDEMACPICGMWQPKDTVAAHADECAQKRYGA